MDELRSWSVLTPQFIELLDKTRDNLGVAGDYHVLVVPHHSSSGPVEGPVDKQTVVHNAELVVH